MKLLVLSLLVILSLTFGLAKINPSISKICSRSDPQRQKCIIDVVHELRSNLASEEFGEGRQAPKLDPYDIKLLHFENPSGFNLTMTNATITGIGGYKIRSLSDDLSKRSFDFLFDIPTLYGKGRYDLNMNVLFVPVNGKGFFNMTLFDTIADVKTKYFLEQRDDKKFVKFSPVDIKLKFNKAQFYLENLGDFANGAINANPSLLLDQVKPGIESHLMSSLTKMANAVIDGAEEHEIFLP
ncbi:uncharacterized protein LOC131431757 [Malaya genurostris]|uniref:uncharacterized protein LOC131431757 n=1 Tax=Malaya genurostris TaxID=325434 RepID=UPI0026F39544|nr:uncharacterized protein LOC131431757 [Malaya genurostris]